MNRYPSLAGDYNGQILRLVSGQPVALRFTARDRTVLLTPGKLFGFPEYALVVAGIGEKCGIVDLRDITLTPFIKAGLSAHAATVLKTELERTYANADSKTYDYEASSAGREKARRAGRKTGGTRQAKQPGNGRGRKKPSTKRTQEDAGTGRAAPSAA